MRIHTEEKQDLRHITSKCHKLVQTLLLTVAIAKVFFKILKYVHVIYKKKGLDKTKQAVYVILSHCKNSFDGCDLRILTMEFNSAKYYYDIKNINT